MHGASLIIIQVLTSRLLYNCQARERFASLKKSTREEVVTEVEEVYFDFTI